MWNYLTIVCHYVAFSWGENSLKTWICWLNLPLLLEIKFFNFLAKISTYAPSVLLLMLACDDQVKWGIAGLARRAPIHSTASTIHFRATDHYSSDGRQMVMNWRWYQCWTILEAVSCANCFITLSQWCCHPRGAIWCRKLHKPPPPTPQPPQRLVILKGSSSSLLFDAQTAVSSDRNSHNSLTTLNHIHHMAT